MILYDLWGVGVLILIKLYEEGVQFSMQGRKKIALRSP